MINETRLAPGLFRAAKMLVDQNRRPGRFLMTGSDRARFGGGLRASPVSVLWEQARPSQKQSHSAATAPRANPQSPH